MFKNIQSKTKNTLKPEKKCDHIDFWSLYKIINFSRKSLEWTCNLCGKEIKLEYLWATNFKKYPLVATFSCLLWISPAILIIVISWMLAEVYGPWIYFLAIIDVVIFHFWAMYYIIKWELVKVI